MFIHNKKSRHCEEPKATWQSGATAYLDRFAIDSVIPRLLRFARNDDVIKWLVAEEGFEPPTNGL